MSATLEMVPFQGDQIEAFRDEVGEVWAPLKKLCANLGMAWNQDQIEKVRSDGALRYEASHIPSAGGVQQAFCLHLDSIPGWLFSIRTAAVADDVKPKLIEYKRRCHAVLREHFFGPARPSGRDRLNAAFLGFLEAAAETAGVDPARYNLALGTAGKIALAVMQGGAKEAPIPYRPTGARAASSLALMSYPSAEQEAAKPLAEQRRGPGVKMSASVRDEVARLVLEDGLTQREVADRFRINRETVGLWVRRARLVRGEPQVPVALPEPKDQATIDRAIAMRAAGASYRDICAALGIANATTVYRWVKRLRPDLAAANGSPARQGGVQ